MTTGTFAGPAPGTADEATPAAESIGGLSVLKGLVLYAATLAFAGLYAFFIDSITTARPGTQPALDGALVAAAAALAGVLGSAFALEIGTTTDPASTNHGLRSFVAEADSADKGSNARLAVARLWQALSIDPRSTRSSSWPKTFGIWVYALVGSAVAVTYVLNEAETPGAIKALAVAFGGYVITLVNGAYKNTQ